MTTDTIGQIKKFLMEYKLESNIPVNHPYWDLLTDFRAGKLDTPEREFKLGPLYQAPPTPELYESAKHSLLRIKIQTILNSYGGKEPNIPFTDQYWFFQNQLKHLDRLEALQ